MRFFKCLLALPVLLAATVATRTAYAWPKTIWMTALVDSATPVKTRIHDFNMQLQWIMLGITIVVAIALFVTVFRFRRGRNPVPSKTTHHVMLEIIWTLIPCLILIYIMFFSFPLMYYADKTEKPDLTLKVTGYQWYWGYSYPDQGIDEYSVYMVPTPENDKKKEFAAARAAPTYQRLLSTYELTSGKEGFVVLPINKNVRILTTANDVIHSWSVPAFGIKKDAVPGRLNETWTRIDKPGIYYGQCSQLCGTLHGFMPIEVRAVPQDVFDTWAAQMKTDVPGAFAYVQNATVQYANKQFNDSDVAHIGLHDLWQQIGGGDGRLYGDKTAEQ